MNERCTLVCNDSFSPCIHDGVKMNNKLKKEEEVILPIQYGMRDESFKIESREASSLTRSLLSREAFSLARSLFIILVQCGLHNDLYLVLCVHNRSQTKSSVPALFHKLP